ncbi:MAG: hypothetical protein J6Y91_02110 [Alphaproteobacteria bacterium]|jgi:hypothetical protein|nr:hypothetical protein [Alphaproteobacteria bacterium]
MIEDMKVLLFIIVAAVLSAVLRFKTIAQFCFDAVLGFVMGYSFYLLLAYWIADGATRAGFTGIIIIWCRPLYDWANDFIRSRLSDLLYKTTHGDKWEE